LVSFRDAGQFDATVDLLGEVWEAVMDLGLDNKDEDALMTTMTTRMRMITIKIEI